ncbi:unnamed protein product [Strongylus vulgaris]|uniref:Uncharacterized protein n=1 Tax=Strongylus vulgaris TaxID=40348 RepID=A0A3P7LCW6_STRVU|nr:unnamed protein product [Strongylus vulgaris]
MSHIRWLNTKEVNRNLDKIWALCNNDKFLAEELLDAISTGFTHFLVLYALHTLRTLTKVGLRGDLARFYYIPTYIKIKERFNLPAEGSRQSDNNMPNSQSVSLPSLAADSRPQFNSASGSAQNNNSAPVAEVQTQNAAELSYRRSGSLEDVNPLPVKRLKVEPAAVGNTPLKLFPRDRPPDDIPVYDYSKVKREKFDVKFAQLETESRISHSSSSHHISGSASASVDEWDEVLRSIDADPAVPPQYKVMFRCLVMSNRDLRDHNKILRSQLEKR